MYTVVGGRFGCGRKKSELEDVCYYLNNHRRYVQMDNANNPTHPVGLSSFTNRVPIMVAVWTEIIKLQTDDGMQRISEDMGRQMVPWESVPQIALITPPAAF